LWDDPFKSRMSSRPLRLCFACRSNKPDYPK